MTQWEKIYPKFTQIYRFFIQLALKSPKVIYFLKLALKSPHFTTYPKQLLFLRQVEEANTYSPTVLWPTWRVREFPLLSLSSVTTARADGERRALLKKGVLISTNLPNDHGYDVCSYTLNARIFPM